MTEARRWLVALAMIETSALPRRQFAYHATAASLQTNKASHESSRLSEGDVASDVNQNLHDERISNCVVCARHETFVEFNEEQILSHSRSMRALKT
jgi:hypothetical protein